MQTNFVTPGFHSNGWLLEPSCSLIPLIDRYVTAPESISCLFSYLLAVAAVFSCHVALFGFWRKVSFSRVCLHCQLLLLHKPQAMLKCPTYAWTRRAESILHLHRTEDTLGVTDQTRNQPLLLAYKRLPAATGIIRENLRPEVKFRNWNTLCAAYLQPVSFLITMSRYSCSLASVASAQQWFEQTVGLNV